MTGWRADPTPAGFVFEERWEEWYAGLLAFQEYPLEDGKREGGRLGGKLDWCRLLITETREHMAQFPSQRQVGETARTPAVVLDHVQPPCSANTFGSPLVGSGEVPATSFAATGPMARTHMTAATAWQSRPGALFIPRAAWLAREEKPRSVRD